MTKDEQIKNLRKQVEVLEKRIEDLEVSRSNAIESSRNTHIAQKERLEYLEKASADISKMHNSIMMFLAKRDGRIIIPKNHMDITKDWKHETYVDGDNYIYQIKEDKE